MRPTSPRERMVRTLRERGITDPRVLAALREVPRERFVDEALAAKAYADASLPIGEQQTISQPWIVASMTELVAPDGAGRVLEIGTGSGYQAAVLSKVFDQVYTVERLPSLSTRARQTMRALRIENVHFKIFDGSYGWSQFAPYRAILVTAAAPDVPKPLLDQLADGGHLVLPIGESQDAAEQMLVRVTRRGTEFVRERAGACRFVPLVGKFGF